MASIVNIGLWNWNGLLQHKHEGNVILKLNNIDILLVSEARCTIYSTIYFPGYKFYFTAHPKPQGGTAIIIKNCFCHYESVKYKTIFSQATTVVVELRTCNTNVSADINLRNFLNHWAEGLLLEETSIVNTLPVVLVW